MPYRASLLNTDAYIAAKDLDAAYEAMRDLDKRDDLKRAGCPESPAFAWMPANFSSVYETAQEVFEALGFIVDLTDDGDLCFDGFEGSSGQEHLFLRAVAPYVYSGFGEEEAYMTFEGDDDLTWTYTFEDGVLKVDGVPVGETQNLCV